MANEVEYYKQMYGQAAASAAAANALTWAALALVVAVVTIILAVQYFFNIQLNRNELESIRIQNAAQIAEQGAAIQTALLATISAELTANRTIIQQLESQLRESIAREAAINRGGFSSYFNQDYSVPPSTPVPSPPEQIELSKLISELGGTLRVKGDTSIADEKVRKVISLLEQVREIDKPTYMRLDRLAEELHARDNLGQIQSLIRTDFISALAKVGIYELSFPDFKKTYRRAPPE
jgi:hypothetical protein